MTRSVIHLAPSVGRPSFGLGPPPLNLARYQAVMGLNSGIYSADRQTELDWASANSGCPREQLSGFRQFGPGNVVFSPAMSRALWSAERCDLVHQHGTWTLQGLYASIWARRYRRPLVLAPHGSFTDWALAKSRFRKRLAWRLYQRWNLMCASAVHAVSRSEILETRRLGYKGPIAYIPNGISAEWIDNLADGDRFRAEFRIPAAARILLFLSRVSPKKGLGLLIDALERIDEIPVNWCLVIAGPDEFGYEAVIRSRVAASKIADRVHFVGGLFGQLKRDAFQAADIFVLPSYSEGAPFVVLEALGAGLPVITTKGSPWSRLVTEKCGWWVDIDAASMKSALVSAFGSDTTRLREMGERGRGLVRGEFAWEGLARRSLDLYNWLWGIGGVPSFVDRGVC
ncbi:group 1 glycosyl transferase [Opitutus sp. ER46]|nr:group 1 glycosyl transferase [Opitutus sp. ER46]